ncbi:Serine threonine- kinase N2 [Pelobates cultripes]|uniref:Serine threonine- kinase N2, partial n=1 Tax=Pelobates cultripes TaxID=61616 RepID=A0AAD1SCN5_PELCU|nr:Serine threonine- kinase N2 [Pelobates cultripes]
MAATILDVTMETAKDLLQLVGETSQTMTRMSVMDHFDSIKELGKDSYGKVLLANHRRSGQLVALKMLVKEKTLADNFLLENSTCVYLGIHPHIITTFRMAFETPSSYVFVQEVVPAGTLHSIVTKVGIQEDIVKRCILQLTSALEFMHYKGLVHRDIKLNNILLMDHECHCIKLADFGLTRLQGTYVPGMSWIIPYMAPELCIVGDSEQLLLHPSLDVWAFGVLVYVMLTVCFPWDEALPRDQQYLQFVHWQVFKDTVPIPAEWRLVTTESQHFFRLMLAIDATDRCSVSHIVEYIHWPWKAHIPHKDITCGMQTNQKSAVSETQVNDIIEQGAGEHPATPAISTLEKRIEELSHRLVIERAVAEGAKRAIKALDHGKPLVQAQSILNQANEKLDLLKYSMEELVKELPDSHPRKSITTEELFLNSDISKPTALTGTLKVRVKGCHNILENVPGRLKDPPVVLSGRRTRQGRFSLMSRIRRNNRVGSQNIQETVGFSNEVRAQLKIDHIPVGSTSWKTVSKQSWNEKFKLELNKSRELELSLYWHDRRSLCAIKTLKLEEFLVNRKQELCLQLEPQGTLFIKVTFSNASIQKRPKLQTIQKFFSKKQEETFQPTAEEDTSIDILPLPVSDTESVVPSPPAVDTDAEETIKSTSEEDITSDVLPLTVLDTESVVQSLRTVANNTEQTMQSASEEGIISGSVPLPVSDTESVVPSPPAVDTNNEEIIQSTSEEIVFSSLPLPVSDTESVVSSLPAIDTDTEETIHSVSEEDIISGSLPLPVSDTESVVPSPPAVDTNNEEIIQSTSEEIVFSSLPLPVSDTESVVSSLPAIDTDTEETIHSVSEEDIISGSLPLPVFNTESGESSPLAVANNTEETIHSVSEEAIISGSLPLPVFDTESVESSPPTDNTDSQEASQSMSEDGAIDLLPLPVCNTGSQESSWSISVSPVVSSDTESEPEESPVAHHTSFCSDQPGLHVIIPDILSQDSGACQVYSRDYTSNQVPCNTPLHDGRVSNQENSVLQDLEQFQDPCIHREVQLSLKDFQCLSVLGRGHFGKVLLVDHKRTNTTFALKVQKKRKIIASNSIDCLKYEKNIFQTISRIRHPFLVNLYASFQTEDLVCFVMEYAAGGDLMSTLNNNMAAFTESRAMFYAACCVLGLEFLHQNKIAHRDLKLRNIVVDKDGYAKITDFGLSKQGMGYSDRTNSFCGTLEYMAPEIFERKPYARSVDWWSLGVVIYVMLCGRFPFTGKDRETEISYKVVNTEPDYPEFLSLEALSIIKSLMNKNSRSRLGARIGASAVKKHPFFKGVDWSALLFKNIINPFVPSIAGPGDVSHFDRAFTTLDPILTPPEESPLEDQDLFQDFDWVADWI